MIYFSYGIFVYVGVRYRIGSPTMILAQIFPRQVFPDMLF